MILAPKLVALDSGHWVSLLRDALSANKESQILARRFFEDLLQLNYTVLFSLNHLRELLAINDPNAAARRLRFLRSLSFLSWIGDINAVGGNTLGSIADVFAAEVTIAYAGRSNTTDVRDAAKTLFLRSGSGCSVVPDDDWYPSLINHWSQIASDRARTITAISPFEFISPSTKLGDFTNGKMRTREQAVAIMKKQQISLLAEIREKGDRRIRDADERAAHFIQDCTQMAINIADSNPASAREFVFKALAEVGIDEDEVNDETTMGKLDRLILFRSQLRIVAEKIGVPFDILKREIDPDVIPSWIIGSALWENAQATNERKGSDLNDRYLGMLAAYVDVLYVDKRTLENFRRARMKNPELVKLVYETRKAPNYTDILEDLSRH